MGDDRVTISAALVRAVEAAKGIAKDARNDFNRYDYTSAEHMLDECRQVLAAQGLVFCQLGWDYTPAATQPTNNKGELKRESGHLRITHVLMHSESAGELRVVTDWAVVPDNGRPQDKAEAAALTSAYSYALRGLLMLPRLGQDEMGRRDDRPQQGTQQQPALSDEQPYVPAADGDPAWEALGKELARKLQAATSQSALEGVVPDIARAKEQGMPADFIARLREIFDECAVKLEGKAAA